ncbi:glycosyltransferase family 4 protein [Bordetella sp. LUAb4]|uniref:glycosyltransferase family 4 protein n=1 Tax=Bordetella sp. LUAb4 TaxID=2843195 RepID=UPI001E4D94CF|nr:glycosyltransferase [Bordetella sp. LUAb4]
MGFSTVLKRVLRRLVWERREIRTIAGSRYFDGTWYAAKYSDIGSMPPAMHYLRHGAQEGRDPSRDFSTSWYLETNVDVKDSGTNPLLHFINHGLREGRLPFPIAGGQIIEEKPSSLGEDLELLVSSELFDPIWYVNNYPDVKGHNPYLHFLENGGNERREASLSFNSASYLSMYPDVDVRYINPLIHYLRFGKDEGRTPGLSNAKKWAIDQTINDVQDLDPEFEACHPLYLDRRRLPTNVSMPRGQVPQVWSEIFQNLHDDMKYLVFVPWLIRGGADLAAVNLVKVAIEKHGTSQVLLVLTDYDRTDALDWLPAGTQVLVLSDFDIGLGMSDRQRIVELLIFTLLPISVLNINSGACWNVIRSRGIALRSMTDIYACLFCRDYAADGRGVGYSDTHFRACLPYLTKIYLDTSSFIDYLKIRYGIPPDNMGKLQLLRQPVSFPRNASNPRPELEGPARVLWAGRFCHQKNTELLTRIIPLLPDVIFEVYGSGDEDRRVALEELAASNANLKLHGSFKTISELPLDSFSVFLFTSRFEGMPTILIDLAAAGLPIVASSVGGVPELIDDDSGWLITDTDNEIAYADAIKDAIGSGAHVRGKIDRMVSKLCNERSWQAFSEAAAIAPSFLIEGRKE